MTRIRVALLLVPRHLRTEKGGQVAVRCEMIGLLTTKKASWFPVGLNYFRLISLAVFTIFHPPQYPSWSLLHVLGIHRNNIRAVNGTTPHEIANVGPMFNFSTRHSSLLPAWSSALSSLQQARQNAF